MTMMENSYKSIAKSNALFGGVQIYNILIGIVRSKALALLLGPEGMGIMGLYNSTLELVKGATYLGLSNSSVRDVAIANSSGDQDKVKEIILVISRLVWITGLVGALIVFLFAKQLSLFTFESYDYTWGFRLLSVVLIIWQLTVKNTVILQGLRFLRKLAKSNLAGSTLGLLFVVPLYYFWGYDAIVPSIILFALITYLVTLYYSRGIKTDGVSIPFKKTLSLGKTMIILGFMLSLTGFMDIIQGYVTRIFIARMGDVSQVGLHNAGFGIVMGYMGLVFSSIGTDFFTRLSAVNNSKEEYNELVNKQLVLMLLVLTPIVIAFIVLSPLAIIILYSEKFLPITMMVNWIAAGMILRAVSWCQGNLYIAKGDSKLYLFIYFFAFVKDLGLALLFYSIFGLTGIGMAFYLSYVIGVVVTLFLVKWKYECIYFNSTYRLILIAIGSSMAALILSHFRNDYVYIFYIFSFLIFTFVTIYSYRQLNEKLGLAELIKKYTVKKQ